MGKRKTASNAATAALLMLMAAPLTPLAAQETDADAAAQTDEVYIRTAPVPEIEVTGERPLTRREISRNVYELAQSNEIGTPIPRFHDPLCLSVSGLGEVLDKRVGDLIRDNATQAEMEIGQTGCTTNALVLVVDNPERLIERLREERPELFNRRANQEILGAISRNDPVIAWARNAIRNSKGQSLNQAASVSGAAGQALFDNPAANVPTTDAYIASRTRIGYSVAREVSVVVFDVRRLEEVHLNQLADYATMFLIGSPRRLLDFEKLEGRSILTLFKDGPWDAPTGLTQLDRAYLRGLYTLKPNENSSRLASSTRAAYTQIANGECVIEDDDCGSDDG